ncbi:hypothetical protein BBK36DRAFT_1199561 [Trichoderma citrinoviride]|uniref:Uncharacterized protein n=1 Tax=Trichoderma citrinoviride TaxID=58853 RepID=A0A2T4BCQ0_9HYPO|nr:hypothetical protein BBK36DRAFT_1199561 [Trichoderma citrinoviride]PTB67104.1 hypothetical protein BBK36DRAFT_1199561 [Trichoderma citrinoviride]
MASIAPPDLASLLAPILPALPAAAVSTEPATGILPLLSPILRQRVNLFSSSSTEPWLKLLCYDSAKAAKLVELVQSGCLEPHPVSGEVEVDWSYDAQTRYRRLDPETLQALTVLSELGGLAFQLVYCVNDAAGGGDGWRVGEMTLADKAAPFAQFGGVPTIAEAEAKFKEPKPAATYTTTTTNNNNGSTTSSEDLMDDDDDDDGYWDRYDATPARTPANNRSPAPRAGASAPAFAPAAQAAPAMDNHDPDEEALLRAHVQPPLGLGSSRAAADPSSETRSSWSSAAAAEADNNSLSNSSPKKAAAADLLQPSAQELALLHPRPESSASSNGSNTVARLEASAGKQEQNEFGVKQHVSRSIRSLYLLARSSGIEREEFERLVKTEMDILSLIEDEE